jgi:hypothetical protein
MIRKPSTKMARLQALMLALPTLLLSLLSFHAQVGSSSFDTPSYTGIFDNSGTLGLPTIQEIPTNVLIEEVAGRIGVE